MSSAPNRPSRRTATPVGAALLLAAAAAAATGCQTGRRPADAATTAPAGPDIHRAAEARAALAARAAAATDRREVAVYRYQQRGHRPRTVVLTRARDGGWRADITDAALGGTADVAVVRSRDGLFQCALGGAGAADSRCAAVGGPRDDLPAAYDPQVQRVLVEALDVLTDRQPAITADPVNAPPGVEGDCWSVQSNSASLPAPLDVGVYCYRTDGLLTGGEWDFGTLVLAGEPTTAPPQVGLPGPLGGDPLPMAGPSPTPPATPTR